MAIPRKTRGNGGFLNNATGLIQSYSLEQKDGIAASGPNKGGAFKKFSAKLTILPEGATEPKTQFLDGGFLEGDLNISEDGRSIEGTDRYLIDEKTEFGMFLISAVEGEGTKLAEDEFGDWRSFGAIENLRCSFKRVPNEAETKRRGMRKVKGTDGKTREYGRDNLLIGDVLGRVEAAKGARKATAAKATAAKPAAAAKTAAVDTDTVDAALVDILGLAGGETTQQAISGLVLKFAMAKKLSTEDREAIRKVVTTADYLSGAAERGIVTVAGEGKTATITLAA